MLQGDVATPVPQPPHPIATYYGLPLPLFRVRHLCMTPRYKPIL